MNKSKFTCLILLTGLIIVTSCVAQSEIVPDFYQKVTTEDSDSPGESGGTLHVEIASDLSMNLPVIEANPIHLNLHQKIGSIEVYQYSYHHDGLKKINGRRVLRFYSSLDKDSVDSELLKIEGGKWGWEQYFFLGNTSETYQFEPQKVGSTRLRYNSAEGTSIVEIPIIIDDNAASNEEVLPPASGNPSDQQ